jgi:hypothetical protein
MTLALVDNVVLILLQQVLTTVLHPYTTLLPCINVDCRVVMWSVKRGSGSCMYECLHHPQSRALPRRRLSMIW